MREKWKINVGMKNKKNITLISLEYSLKVYKLINGDDNINSQQLYRTFVPVTILSATYI